MANKQRKVWARAKQLPTSVRQATWFFLNSATKAGSHLPRRFVPFCEQTKPLKESFSFVQPSNTFSRRPWRNGQLIQKRINTNHIWNGIYNDIIHSWNIMEEMKRLPRPKDKSGQCKHCQLKESQMNRRRHSRKSTETSSDSI